MRLIIAVTACLTLFVSFSACAELPEYTVKRTTEKIVIDGILDEAYWVAAESL